MESPQVQTSVEIMLFQTAAKQDSISYRTLYGTIKGGSRHFDLGGLYNGKSRNLMKIQAPLGGSGGMPPQEILTYSCSETASGAI